MNAVAHTLIGASPPLARVIDFIQTVASMDATVLLEGESGTGKELVAEALHRNSKRANRPFVAVNCAALGESTIENELFGHEREGFTGANSRQKGRFEMADGGTLFLDEIGELPRQAQSKLLRAVEYGQIQRIGSGHTIQPDVRLIVATNRDLRAAVAAREFREDLYYRLHMMSLKLPPLRDRPDDISLLVRHFFEMCPAGSKGRVTEMSPEAEAVLRLYHWPGNVRQLKHVVERMAAFANPPIAQLRDLPPEVFEVTPSSSLARFDQAVTRAKREIVDTVMREVNGNIKRAGETLGKHPAGLYRLLDDLNLSHWKGAGPRS